MYIGQLQHRILFDEDYKRHTTQHGQSPLVAIDLPAAFDKYEHEILFKVLEKVYDHV